MKKKRVETFRNIRYPVGRTISGRSYHIYTSAMLSIVGERERTLYMRMRGF